MIMRSEKKTNLCACVAWNILSVFYLFEISEAYYVLRDPSRRAEYDGNRLKSDSMSFTDADSMFNDFHGAPIHEVLEAIARNKRMPGMGRNVHFHMPEHVQIDSRDMEGFNTNILD